MAGAAGQPFPERPGVLRDELDEAAVGTFTGPQLPPVTTRTLRERLGTWVRPDQRRTVVRWCDWADAVLGSPGPAVLWRSEAGLPLADHRTPPRWVEDLAARFSALSINPEAPPPD